MEVKCSSNMGLPWSMLSEVGGWRAKASIGHYVWQHEYGRVPYDKTLYCPNDIVQGGFNSSRRLENAKAFIFHAQ